MLVTGFDGYAYGITLGINNGVELDFPDRSFEGFNDGKINFLVVGFVDGINSDVG